jgi:hypothetical protein
LHALVPAAGQLPAPLQNEASVAVLVDALQLGPLHITPDPGYVHAACVPLQVPAQVPLPAQAAWLARGAPVTKPQVPGVVPLQNSQDPLQAVLQQTPSTEQIPPTHSVPPPHGCPSRFLHAPLASQVLVPVQLSASAALLTATQVPGLAVLTQVRHVPPHATLQHTPSEQTPLWHSVPRAHAAPFALAAAPPAPAPPVAVPPVPLPPVAAPPVFAPPVLAPPRPPAPPVAAVVPAVPAAPPLPVTAPAPPVCEPLVPPETLPPLPASARASRLRPIGTAVATRELGGRLAGHHQRAGKQESHDPQGTTALHARHLPFEK